MTTRRLALTRVEIITLMVCVLLLSCCFLSMFVLDSTEGYRLGHRAQCMSNLSGIGKAMWMYASEQPGEPAIPIHPNVLAPARDEWQWRTIDFFAWGGVDATKLFGTQTGTELWLSDSAPPRAATARPDYARPKRPLSRYDCAEREPNQIKRALEKYQCPKDTGYPKNVPTSDSPAANAGRSCFETLGNSYRANLLPLATRDGDAGKPMERQFSLGPWGTRISTLTKTSELAWVAEPLFFSMLSEAEADPNMLQRVQRQGWHGRPWRDNVLFVDGSVRTAHIRGLGVMESPATQPAVMSDRWLARGDWFRLDTYPVGGARIFGDWSDYMEKAAGRWPFADMQDNLGRP